MKKTILTTFVLGTSLFVYSFGENPKNSEKNEAKQENQLSVSATKMNILYVGLDNPLDIAIPNESSENISVIIDNGTVEKKSGIEWIARVYKTGKTTVQVFVEKNGVKTLYGTKEFRAYRVPDPEPKILGAKEMAIDKETVMKNPNLEIVLDNFQFDGNFFKVSSFTFLISSKNATKEVKCTDGKISQEGIEMLKNSNSGDMLTFADIKITDIGGTTRKISPMTIRLK
jgi:hypothetical protein